VQKEIEERAGRRVSRGALYVTLDRLEEKGYVRSRPGASTAARGGRPRRYLAVSPAGIEALQGSRSMLRNLSTGLEGVLDER
jgi:DNA-binding PadR family transcriptional regulator